MQCYATENLVKEKFSLDISSMKRCTESMKDKFLKDKFSFQVLVQLKFEVQRQKMQNLVDILTFWNKIS